MGFFTKTKSESRTKCSKCGSELHDSARLERHMKIAHGKKNDKCRPVSYTHLTLPTKA